MNREGEVIRKTLIPFVFYCLAKTAIGQALITGNPLCSGVWQRLGLVFFALLYTRKNSAEAAVNSTK